MPDEKRPWYKGFPFGIFMWCLTVVFSAGIIYAMAKDAPIKHKELRTYTQKVEVKADATEKIAITNRQDIAVMKNDLQYIKQGIGDIKRAVMRPRRREGH